MQAKQLGRVLAVAAGVSALALAQGPLGGFSGMGMGRGGPFGFAPMGSALGMGLGAAVTGLPFDATATLTMVRPGRDGGASTTRQQTFQLARDAEGRTWVETTLPAFHGRGGNDANGDNGGSAPQQVVYINDPVARTSHVYYPARQLATERNYPAPPPNGTGTRGRGWNGGGRGGHRQNTATTSLGQEDISGVEASGTQRVTTLPPPPGAQDQQPRTVTLATWVSADLHLIMERQATISNGGQSDYKIDSLQQGPQDSSLFTLPAGTTIRPARGFGRARGGRG